jgi:hypothetical protein
MGLAVYFDNRPLFCPGPISQSANTKYINNQTVKHSNYVITLACRPSVLNPSFSVFCFLRRREMEFALAHRRLRVQRLSQNAIDPLGSVI